MPYSACSSAIISTREMVFRIQVGAGKVIDLLTYPACASATAPVERSGSDSGFHLAQCGQLCVACLPAGRPRALVGQLGLDKLPVDEMVHESSHVVRADILHVGWCWDSDR